jgi:hypothetical protein
LSYSTIETAVVNVIKKNADFGATGVTAARDTKGVGKGLSRFCLVSYSSDRTQDVTIKYTIRTWVLNVDVFVPWRGDLPTLEASVATEVQKVKDILAQYPRLDGCSGVVKADLTQGNFPDLLSRAKGSWKGKRSILEVQECLDPGRVE